MVAQMLFRAQIIECVHEGMHLSRTHVYILFFSHTAQAYMQVCAHTQICKVFFTHTHTHTNFFLLHRRL